MQPHFITNLLGIKDSHVYVFDSGEEEEKDRISGKHVDWYVKKRRYRCLACRHTFFENYRF